MEGRQEYREYVTIKRKGRNTVSIRQFRGKAGIKRVYDNLEQRQEYREYVTILREDRNTESM
jgi:hypothetical protein